jgi:hypothetical protein
MLNDWNVESDRAAEEELNLILIAMDDDNVVDAVIIYVPGNERCDRGTFDR